MSGGSSSSGADGAGGGVSEGEPAEDQTGRMQEGKLTHAAFTDHRVEHKSQCPNVQSTKPLIYFHFLRRASFYNNDNNIDEQFTCLYQSQL